LCGSSDDIEASVLATKRSAIDAERGSPASSAIEDDDVPIRWVAEEPHADDSLEPVAFAGVMRKRCGGLWRRSTTRFFALRAGCFIWAAQEPLCGPADHARSCVDFSKTECEVLAEAAGCVTLRPLPGRKWHHRDAHSRAGTARPICLDFGGDAEAWAERLDRHIAYGRALRRGRLALTAQGRFAALGLEDCCNVEESCAVCLESLDGAAVRTPCGHAFHRDCVQRWAMKTASCPLCRADLGDGRSARF